MDATSAEAVPGSIRMGALTGMGRTAVSPVVRRLGPLGHPARLTVVGFAVVNVLGALLLMLPMASESGEWTAPVTALFTSTSAVCVVLRRSVRTHPGR